MAPMANRAAKAATPPSARGSDPLKPRAALIRSPHGAGGFTLLELMLVVTLIAIAVSMVTLAFRDADAARLEEEGARLSALFEGARARARAEGTELMWQPGKEAGSGFRFIGLPPEAGLPTQWLDERTRGEIIGAPALRLGPEPVIGAQRVVLRIEERQLVLATDGMGPFVVVAPEAP
jgi:general secretion pathway protein H